MIHNHRQVYQVIRQELLEGPASELWETAEQMRREGFGWRYDGLGDWTTDAIFKQLGQLGIDADLDRFEAQAKDAGRILELEEKWREGVDIDDETPWDDFPFLAAEELWKRMTPDLLCPELIASRLEEVIEGEAENVDWNNKDAGKKDFEAAMLLMDYLEGFSEQKRDEAFDEVMNCSAYDFGGWLIDVAADYGENFIEEAQRIAQVMLPTAYAMNLHADFAYSLVKADHVAEAERLVEDNLERWPENVWVRINSGDIYCDLGEQETGMELYVSALKMAEGPFDWKGAAKRLRPLLKAKGRQAEWQELRKRHPKPKDPPIIPFSNAARTSPETISSAIPSGPIGVLTSGSSPGIVQVSGDAPLANTKVGRNDPCPCGSGKKYKKCCFGRY